MAEEKKSTNLKDRLKKTQVGAAAPAVGNAAPAATPATMPSASPLELAAAAPRAATEGADSTVLSIGDVAVTEAPDFTRGGCGGSLQQPEERS